MKNSYEIMHLVSGQDWACKFVTFRLVTRDDVVSQRLKFGSAFLSSSWESKIALFFLTFPYPVPVPKNCVDFYWPQRGSTCKSGWIAQAEKKILRQQRREKYAHCVEEDEDSRPCS